MKHFKVISVLSLIVLPNSALAISADMNIAGDHHAIRVIVNSDGQKRIANLDTGSPVTTFFKDDSNILFPVVGTRPGSGASGVAIQCDRIEPQTTAIGSIAKDKYQISRCEMGSHGYNVLGIDFFADKIFELNFSDNKIQIVDKIPNATSIVKFEQLPVGHLSIEINLAGRITQAIFDTAWQGNSAVDASYVLENPDLFTMVGHQVVFDALGNPMDMNTYKLNGTLKIADVEFTDLVFASKVGLSAVIKRLTHSPDFQGPFIIGSNAIVQANWFIDLKNKAMAIEPRKF